MFDNPPQPFANGTYTCTVCPGRQHGRHPVIRPTNHHDNTTTRKQHPRSTDKDAGCTRRINTNGLSAVMCVVFIVCFISTVSAQGDGNEVPDQMLSVLEGGSVVLPCTLTNPLSADIAWSTSGSDIYFINTNHWYAPSRFGIEPRDNVYDLTLNVAERLDDRLYQCTQSDQLTPPMTTYLTVIGKLLNLLYNVYNNNIT